MTGTIVYRCPECGRVYGEHERIGDSNYVICPNHNPAPPGGRPLARPVILGDESDVHVLTREEMAHYRNEHNPDRVPVLEVVGTVDGHRMLVRELSAHGDCPSCGRDHAYCDPDDPC